MKAFYEDDTVQLYLGDCLDILPTLADVSVDAIVCDPPYGLADHHPRVIAETLAAWLAGDRASVPDGRGFMGREWDRFVPPPAVWDECLRVLKPGGHLLAFSAPRTVDLMTLSIRLAGFEIRDSLMWVFGSGMPKGQNIGKAIDKAAGVERAVVGRRDRYRDGRERQNLGDRNEVYGTGLTANGVVDVTAPATDDAARWEGWNTQLRPAHEPIVLARKSTGFNTIVANVLEHGTGAINVDGCRTATVSAGPGTTPQSSVAGRRGSMAGSLDRVDYDGSAGRWPTNVLLGHGPDCIDGGDCQTGCPVADMDRQSGISTSPTGSVKGQRRSGGIMGQAAGSKISNSGHGDTGGASRYFPIFRYEAKAPKVERPRLADGTAWPTVKPLALMRWLVRLVTPPGGTVLDWCAGTGTTLEAARLEGFNSIGVEREKDAAELCRIRLAKPYMTDLFGGAA
jgi:site-specific DNA-methyltransferase (adenine-specific)